MLSKNSSYQMRMLAILIVQVVIWGSISSLAINRENAIDPSSAKSDPRPWPPNSTVCYEIEGCFSNSFPFNNSANYLPTTPQILNTEFLLFNKKNFNKEQSLSYTDLNTIRASTFDSDLPLKFIIHGFQNNRDTFWLNNLKNEILNAENVNVIIVAWGNGAAFPSYPNASSNTRLVGKQTGLLLGAIRKVFPKELNIHCIGHSLGAHTCAYASNAAFEAISKRFNRISALDPAGPNFEKLNEIVRLDPSDADFIDVLHTNGNEGGLLSASFGMYSPVGHVDVFVNGGYFQAGCPPFLSIVGGIVGGADPSTDLGCSHNRAPIYFTESVTNKNIVAYGCESLASFDTGKCVSCASPNQCIKYGYHSNEAKARGLFFFNTNANKPFAGYQHLFELTVSNQSPAKAIGDLFLTIDSDSENTIKVFNGETIAPSTIAKKIIANRIELGTVDTFELKFIRKPSLISFLPNSNPDKIIFDKVKLFDIEGGKTYTSCMPNTELKTENLIVIKMNLNDCN